MLELDLKTEFKHFDWRKLANVRGAAHDVIIGAWANWWIDIDPKRHMVLNPAHKVDGRLSDLMFFEGDKDYIYHLVGVAEIENNPDKWIEKIETLRKYWKTYRSQKCISFLLLCASTSPEYETRFDELKKHVRSVSETTEPAWVLYRLDVADYKKDFHAIVRKDEMVWFYSHIVRGRAHIAKEGHYQ